MDFNSGKKIFHHITDILSDDLPILYQSCHITYGDSHQTLNLCFIYIKNCDSHDKLTLGLRCPDPSWCKLPPSTILAWQVNIKHESMRKKLLSKQIVGNINVVNINVI